jgi:hypothetical protein
MGIFSTRCPAEETSDKKPELRAMGLCIIGARGNIMRQLAQAALLAVLVCAFSNTVFPQLRYNSDYSVDRLNTDQTSFTLHASGSAEYRCASEWTTMTIQTNLTKTAMFLWHFKDGTKAFARQVEYVGDIGARTEFLMINPFANLEDRRGNKIQPMTRDNYPVRVEVWIGEYGEADGYSPEGMIDKACFDATAIEYDRTYQFKNCQ